MIEYYMLRHDNTSRSDLCRYLVANVCVTLARRHRYAASQDWLCSKDGTRVLEDWHGKIRRAEMDEREKRTNDM
jgi:hypothetical protein